MKLTNFASTPTGKRGLAWKQFVFKDKKRVREREREGERERERERGGGEREGVSKMREKVGDRER